MIVIFEGADGVGKTTSVKYFNKITKYKHLVIDRAFISNYVYDVFLRKDSDRGRNWIKLLEKCEKAKLPLVFVLISVREENRFWDKIPDSSKRDQSCFELIFNYFSNIFNFKFIKIINDRDLKSLRLKIKRLGRLLEGEWETLPKVQIL